MTAEIALRVPLAKLASHPQDYALSVDAEARVALAARFDLMAIDRLEARLAVARTSAGARLDGALVADVVQACVVSGEPVPAHLEVPLDLRFEPMDIAAHDIELEPEALDLLPVEDGMIDLGEAVAQSLFLALEPWPRADEATLARVRTRLLSEEEAEAAAAAGKVAASPFAQLKRP